MARKNTPEADPEREAFVLSVRPFTDAFAARLIQEYDCFQAAKRIADSLSHNPSVDHILCIYDRLMAEKK